MGNLKCSGPPSRDPAPTPAARLRDLESRAKTRETARLGRAGAAVGVTRRNIVKQEVPVKTTHRLGRSETDNARLVECHVHCITATGTDVHFIGLTLNAGMMYSAGNCSGVESEWGRKCSTAVRNKRKQVTWQGTNTHIDLKLWSNDRNILTQKWPELRIANIKILLTSFKTRLEFAWKSRLD